MIVLIIYLVIVNTIGSDASKQAFDTENYEEVGRHFEEFIIKHGRTYEGKEKLTRFKVFADNLNVINRLNKNSRATYGVTRFADQTFTENPHVAYRSDVMEQSDQRGACKTRQGPDTSDAPAAFDWRDKLELSPAGDTYMCASSWAFSATGLIESRLLMRGQRVNLSVQQLLDCDLESDGCRGGLTTLALTSVLSVGGIESEEQYPYTKFLHKCRFNTSKSVASISSCHTHNITYEESLQELLYKEGPVSITLHATYGWWFYESGVMDDCEIGPTFISVLLVGYGSEDGEDFWIINVFWGNANEDKGHYIKIKRGVGCNGIVSMYSLTDIVTVEL